MTNKDYFNYLIQIAQLDFISPVTCEEEIDPAQLYGYFQCFMPNAENLAEVFKPLLMGQQLHSRLLAFYAFTKDEFNELAAQALTPGYFNSPAINILDEKTLIQLGKQLVNHYLLFSQFIDDQALSKQLNAITTIVIDNTGDTIEPSELDEYLYDVISDWAIANTAKNSLLDILQEAYYSIACDYNISYYFQYPSYQHKPTIDLFRPYFDLWKAHYKGYFVDDNFVLIPYS